MTAIAAVVSMAVGLRIASARPVTVSDLLAATSAGVDDPDIKWMQGLAYHVQRRHTLVSTCDRFS